MFLLLQVWQVLVVYKLPCNTCESPMNAAAGWEATADSLSKDMALMVSRQIGLPRFPDTLLTPHKQYGSFFFFFFFLDWSM